MYHVRFTIVLCDYDEAGVYYEETWQAEDDMPMMPTVGARIGIYDRSKGLYPLTTQYVSWLGGDLFLASLDYREAATKSFGEPRQIERLKTMEQLRAEIKEITPWLKWEHVPPTWRDRSANP